MDDAVRDPVLGTVANVFVLFNDTFRNLPAGACLYDPVNYLYIDISIQVTLKLDEFGSHLCDSRIAPWRY